MIVRRADHWLRMLFVWDGSVLRTVLPQLLLMLAVSSLALLGDGRVFGEKIPLDTAPFPLVGVSLAIFLAFRNNASYARYLEARQVWGHLLIASRALTSQALAYLPDDRAVFDRMLFARRLIAFTHALKHQLRKTDASVDLQRWLPPAEAAELAVKSYRPVAMLDRLRAMLVRAGASAGVRAEHRGADWMFDGQLNELASAVGACERICNTPIPYAYGVLVHRTVYAYCLMLPFGLVDSIGVATPLISVFVSYTLLALEAIAREIAEPFGATPNSLALEAISRTVERSVLEQCGQPMPPEVAVGEGYVLN